MNFNPLNELKVIDTEKELAELNAAIEIDPYNSEALASRGVQKCKSQDYDGSLTDLDRSIELNPKNSRTYFRRSYTHECKGDLKAAIADLDIVIELDPEEPSAYNNRAIHKYYLNDFTGAIADYSKAIEFEPNQPIIYRNSFHAKNAVNDHVGAQADLQKAQELRCGVHPSSKNHPDPRCRIQTPPKEPIQSLVEPITPRNRLPTSYFMHSALEYLENNHKNKGGTGLSTGFEQFDKLTGGLHPGSLNVIAASPYMGTTSFALNIAEYVAVEQKIPVVIFDAEMSANVIALRLLCSRSQQDLGYIHNGYLSKEGLKKIGDAALEFGGGKLYIEEAARPTVMELEERVKSLMSQHQIGLIVINTFELLASPWRLTPDQRSEELTVIAKGLRALARETKIPILVVAALSRDVDNRENPIPALTDLSQSSSLDLEADLVGLLYWPSSFPREEEVRLKWSGDAELIIAKNSLGPLGSVPLIFYSGYSRFENRVHL